MPGPNIFARRTEHPYRAKTVADLPGTLRQLAGQSLGPDEPANAIFVVPPQMFLRNWWGGLRHVPEQALLFTSQGVLHIQRAASPGQIGQTTYLRGDQLVYAHLSLLLLYGRLELVGQLRGALVRIIVEYNTVAHDLLQPALHQFLRLAWGQAQARENEDRTDALLRDLEEQSLKFRNGLRHYALQSDERLLGFVFQPRITQRYWRLFHRLIAPAALLALTDHELIAIEEDRTTSAAYGWLFTFCPRVCVVGIEARPCEAWQDLHVHLARGGVAAERRVTVGNEAALAWQALWTNQGIGTWEKENVSTAVHPG